MRRLISSCGFAMCYVLYGGIQDLQQSRKKSLTAIRKLLSILYGMGVLIEVL